MTRPARDGRAGALLLGGLLAALGLWGFVLVRSLQARPGIEGWLTGVFGGGFLALLTYAGVAWAALFLLSRRRDRRSDEPAAARVTGTLKDTLDELEGLRRRTHARIKVLSMVLVPLGVAAGLTLWWFTREAGEPTDPTEGFMFGLCGAFMGYVAAAHSLSNAYRRRYKERVLPLLAAEFGVTWRPARPPMDEIKRWKLFPPFDGVACEDEIAGDYRGLPTSLVELRLTHGSGKRKRTVFSGLLVTVTLPRALRGVTVVVGDKGLFGNMAERILGRDCERVALEDPGFEAVYEVFGTDQVGARALLTPAFMERFLALGQSGRFGRPVALAHDNRLLLALQTMSGDLFEPPSYWRPAAGRDNLTRLSADIRRVLDAADAVIDLDQSARRAAPVQTASAEQ